ncbi:MAG: TIR domain-containing protein, partial [Pyrinomonadaceae bacterium]
FIFIISPDSVTSGACLKELTLAVKLGKHLIPVTYRGVEASKLPLPLSEPGGISFLDEHNFKQSFELLVAGFDPVLRFDAFISYSRKDQTFIQTLYEALVRGGRKVWIDSKEIQPTEPWMKAVESSIEAADNFIFVLSPHSIASRICQRELAHAVQNYKRLIPLVRQDVDVETVATELSELNWIYFRDGDDFQTSFDLLGRALDTDPEYVREHSRLQVHALEWERSGRGHPKPDKSLLLRGLELRNARRWLAAAERGKKPAPTPLHKTYIAESRRDVLRRRAVISAAVAVSLLLTLFLVQVIRQRTKEVNQQTNIADARRLANQSNLIRAQQANLLPASALYAVAAMSRSPSLDADQALRQSLSPLPLRVASFPHEAKLNDLAFSPDSNYLATASEDGSVRLWDTRSGREVWGQKKEGGANGISFSRSGKYLAAANGDVLTVWETAGGQPVLSFKHGGNVISIGFSPGEESVTTGGYDGVVRVWDLPGGRLLWDKPIRKPVITSAFSPDGKYLATASFDYVVLIWDAATGAQRASLRNEVGAPRLAFSPDGKQIVTASAGEARVWVTATGRKQFAVKHGTYISALAFNPDGSSFATGEQDGFVRLWGATDGQELANIKHGAEIKILSFSPDGAYVASAGADYTARVWSVAGGLEVTRMCHSGEIDALAFSPSGDLVATASSDNVARVWESVGSFERPAIYRFPVEAVALSPDGRYMASKSADRSTRIMETASGKLYWGEKFRGEIQDIAFSPSSEYFAVASRAAGPEDDASDQRSAVKIIRVSDRQEVGILNFGSVVRAVAFGGDGESIATLSDDGLIAMWALTTKSEIWSGSAKQAVTAMTVSPDGRFLATVGDAVSVRRAADGSVVREFEPSKQVAVTAFSPDGSSLAVGDGEGNVSLLDIDSGETRNIVTYESYVVGVAFSSDGRYLASASFDGSAVLTEVMSVKQAAAFKFPDSITTLAISPDARYLTGGGGSAARVFNFAGGQEVTSVSHGIEVKSVAFSRDGKYLASGGADNTARLSPLLPGDLIAEACARMTTNILPSEWEEYTKGRPDFEVCARPPK